MLLGFYRIFKIQNYETTITHKLHVKRIKFDLMVEYCKFSKHAKKGEKTIRHTVHAHKLTYILKFIYGKKKEKKISKKILSSDMY